MRATGAEGPPRTLSPGGEDGKIGALRTPSGVAPSTGQGHLIVNDSVRPDGEEPPRALRVRRFGIDTLRESRVE